MTPGGAKPVPFLVGAAAATAIAAAAYRARALDRSGALAAVFVGAATYGGLGRRGAAVLLAFFVPSIALSRLGRARKSARLVDVDKTGARDGAQVLANGGVAAVCALVAALIDDRYRIAFAGAFAAAAADTWATEIGTLVQHPPRSILTLRPIATGLSGGVTMAGTVAEIAGAAFVAAAAVGAKAIPARAALAVLAGGVAGAVADSVLGASVQSLRWCAVCRRATERDPHVCGAETSPLRGLSWFGNDLVNLCATACGAVTAAIIGNPST